MTKAESDWIMVAGGVLNDPMYRLQKYQDDGCLSLWAGRTDDGPLIDQIAAAARALPLPNGKIRYASVVDLNDKGWRLDHTPCTGSDTLDPDRHYDAVYLDREVTLAVVADFISAFEPPIPNEWR